MTFPGSSGKIVLMLLSSSSVMSLIVRIFILFLPVSLHTCGYVFVYNLFVPFSTLLKVPFEVVLTDLLIFTHRFVLEYSRDGLKKLQHS